MNFVDELTGWLQRTWDPTMALREWWSLLADEGWSQPHWPVEWFGRGLSIGESNEVTRLIREFGAVTGPPSFATRIAGPVLLVHGTDEQRARLLPGIVKGTDSYCQLFSEPNAGSDLAGLQCRAVHDGESWVVNGQKVWNSRARIASRGMLLARTNVDVPKHAGISYFMVEMVQPGVDVRPLREMTGRSFFNEVFLTDARVRDEDMIGGAGGGWAVANTTLSFERAMSGGGEAPATAEAGEFAGNLDRPVGEFSAREVRDTATPSSPSQRLIETAQSLGRGDEPVVRDGLARLYTLERLIALNAARSRSLQLQGRELSGHPNFAKMAENQAVRLGRDLTFEILGPAGALHEYDDSLVSSAGPFQVQGTGDLLEVALFSFAPPIMGGSDQIQRNILGERVLGLPREPSVDKDVAFRNLVKN